MGIGVVGNGWKDAKVLYSGHILPRWDERGEEAEYVGKRSERVGFCFLAPILFLKIHLATT